MPAHPGSGYAAGYQPDRFREERMSLALVYSRAQAGMDAPLVTVEVHISNGLPSLSIVGLPETAVRPADMPDSPPMKVAYRFTNTFVRYEVGNRKAAKQLRRTSTPKRFAASWLKVVS